MKRKTGVSAFAKTPIILGWGGRNRQYRRALKYPLPSTWWPRDAWDRDDTRPAVREAFGKVIAWGTEALGAEVFASDGEERVVYHTCTSVPVHPPPPAD